MKTFSKILQTEVDDSTKPAIKNKVYGTAEKGITVINDNNEYEYVSEPDTVMAMIYLVDRREILLRKEIVPAYQHRDKEYAFYVTCVSGQIEENEQPVDAMVRELYEEVGMKLNRSYAEAEYWGEFFLTKGNSMKTHIFYFPVFKDDYVLEIPKGDGSEIEKNSTTLRISVVDLNNLKPSDIPTAYIIDKFRLKENM